MDSCLPTFQPKDPKLWRILLPNTEFMSLGETLKPVWGLPALKIIDGDQVMLFAPEIPS
jgi:hypothetical protein